MMSDRIVIPVGCGWPITAAFLLLALGGTFERAEAQPIGSVTTDPGVLEAANGVTAVAGRVLGPDGAGLGGVLVSDNALTVRTGPDGRFLVAPVPEGGSVLRIDGRHVGTRGELDYGFYELHVDAITGRTTPLGYLVWLTPINHAHDVTITSPTTAEVIIRNPAIPDLELRIAPGTVIRDVDGAIVKRLGITAVNIKQLPYPLPPNFKLPVFFTIQPGAACLYSADGGVGAARIVYPNFGHELPRARATIWRYEPDAHGWNPFGLGTVGQDGRQVVPDPGVEIADFGSAECDPATRSVMGPPKRQERLGPIHLPPSAAASDRSPPARPAVPLPQTNSAPAVQR